MTTPSTLVIGIDGGGTHSVGALVDGTGRVLAWATGGSLNFFGAGLMESRRTLRHLFAGLNAAMPDAPLRRIVVGSAALFGDATPSEAEKLCQGILPLERTHVLSDCQTAYRGAAGDRAGALIIAGTGSIILIRNESGVFTQTGGWGHLLGDEGSGYWIAREAMRAAAAAIEGRGPVTSLVELICQWAQVPSLKEVVPMIYAPGFTKERFAALSVHLAGHSADEDEVYAEICRRGGVELAQQALAAIRSAGLRDQPISVFLSGSVLRHERRLRASLVGTMEAAATIRVMEPQLPPVLGAASLALEEAGIELTTDVVRSLRSCADARAGNS